MSWYQVLIVLPGTDADAENGFCEPQWWNEMVQAQNESAAIAAANAKARADWGTSDGECPCGKDLGVEYPVCTGGYGRGVQRLGKGDGRFRFNTFLNKRN